MSDMDKIKEILTQRGIVFTVESRPGDYGVVHNVLRINDSCPKFCGYAGFVAAMDFNDEGRLLCVGAWEE